MLAPILLVVLRLVQGFAVAGELGGASAMIVEHAPDARRGFFASFSLQGTQAGSILATAVMLPLATMLDPGGLSRPGAGASRSCSASVVIVAGYVIRRRVQRAAGLPRHRRTSSAETRRFPFVELLRTHPWGPWCVILMTFTNVIGMATLVFGVSYATQAGLRHRLRHRRHAVGDAGRQRRRGDAPSPSSGALSDRVGRRVFMVVGGLVGGLLVRQCTCGPSAEEPRRWCS